MHAFGSSRLPSSLLSTQSYSSAAHATGRHKPTPTGVYDVLPFHRTRIDTGPSIYPVFDLSKKLWGSSVQGAEGEGIWGGGVSLLYSM